MASRLEPLYDQLRAATCGRDRPFVTLTFAQSIDGSIARAPGEMTAISSKDSLRMTHTLRALHDGILVGIGTILADNPELTVRHTRGNHPRPIILDSRLRTPPGARVLVGKPSPWILHSGLDDNGSGQELEQKGARLLAVEVGERTPHDFTAVMSCLYQLGIERLMIEGGARIIHSALEHGIVDLLVLTIAPQLLGGLNPYCAGIKPPRLTNPQWAPLGPDMVLWGAIDNSAA